MLYIRGGQTAAREPHAALRNFACGSLSFSKHYICIFIAKCRNIVKWCCGSLRAVQY